MSCQSATRCLRDLAGKSGRGDVTWMNSSAAFPLSSCSGVTARRGTRSWGHPGLPSPVAPGTEKIGPRRARTAADWRANPWAPAVARVDNRNIELLRHMMNWAVGRQYLNRTPFRRGTETLIRKMYEDNQRRRRLTEAEEGKLLAAAAPMLRSMIIAALDTGMRRGEMLALRFEDIDFGRLADYASRIHDQERQDEVRPHSDRDLAGGARMAATRRGGPGEAGRRALDLSAEPG